MTRPLPSPAAEPTAAERAAAGAALLARHLRPGWARDVDLRRLDVRSMADDPLGQLYGSFGAGVVALFGPAAGGNRPPAIRSPAWLHGFVDGPEDAPGVLEAAWAAEIAARRAAGAPPRKGAA